MTAKSKKSKSAGKGRGGARPNAGRKSTKPKSDSATQRNAAASKEAPPPVKIGRPSDFNEATCAEICNRLCAGESLRTICRDDHMPVCSTVFVWLSKHPVFAEQYARARDVQADAIFEEILDIADDASNDWMERREKENPGWQANGEHIQRSRLRVDARKWMAGKLAPKKYGDKIQVAGEGEGGAIPIIHEVKRVIVDPRNT
jgi:hypothetical protein